MIGPDLPHWVPDDHRAAALAGRAYADSQAAHCAVAHGGRLDIAIECPECLRLFAGYEAIVALIDRAARHRGLG